MSKKIGLGKNIANLGLKELLGEFNNKDSTKTSISSTSHSHLQRLPIDLLKPSKYQPRKAFDTASLEELASSIRTQGLLQPIIVRSSSSKNYEIIAGERRWRAAHLAGLSEVPIILRKLNDEQALAISLIENVQREDLNVIEEAEALQRLCSQFSMTHQEVAETIGKSRATVTNLLRLLSLHKDVKEIVLQGYLEMGHARALLGLSLVQQARAAKILLAKKLSVRETEQLVKNILSGKRFKKNRRVNPDILRLQNELSERLGSKVSVLELSNNKGKLIIHYNSLDELDGILERLL